MRKQLLWMLAAILTTGLTLTSCTDVTDNPVGGDTPSPSEGTNIEEPSDFSSYMDMKTYAGDDFYQYAVGKWLADNPLGKDETENGTPIQQDHVTDKFLASLTQKGGDDEVLRYLIDTYDRATTQNDLKQLREKLATIDAVKNLDGMWTLMATLMSEGYRAPYEVGPTAYQRSVFINFDLPYRINQYSLTEEVLVSYGDMSKADAQKILSVIDRWKDMLVKNGISRQNRNENLPREYRIRTRERMNLTRAGGARTVVETIAQNLNLDEDDNWMARGFNEVNAFLGNLTLDELKAFCKYAVINRDVAFIPNEKVDLSSHLIHLAKSSYSPMGIRFSNLFNKTVPEANRTAAIEMAREFRDIFRERIEKRNWMTSESKARAIEKLDAMKLNFGWPDDDSNRQAWEVKVPEGKLSFYQAVCDIYRQNVEIILSKMDLTSETDLFYANEMENPSYVNNAFYNPNNNEILILSSNLVPPIFDAGRNAAINYAVLGATTIGHEMTHGFDTSGKNFNKHGKEEPWMLPADTLAFNALANKMIAHFDKQTVGSLYTCDGKLTVGENIADLGGLYIGLDAFTKYLDKQGMAGNERERQLREYFRAFAYAWMGNQDDETVIYYITDNHALYPLRVNGNVYLMDAFYRLFNIKGGKRYLAPEKRIEIW